MAPSVDQERASFVTCLHAPVISSLSEYSSFDILYCLSGRTCNSSGLLRSLVLQAMVAVPIPVCLLPASHPHLVAKSSCFPSPCEVTCGPFSEVGSPCQACAFANVWLWTPSSNCTVSDPFFASQLGFLDGSLGPAEDLEGGEAELAENLVPVQAGVVDDDQSTHGQASNSVGYQAKCSRMPTEIAIAAAADGDVERLRAGLQEGWPVDKTCAGATALHWAAGDNMPIRPSADPHFLFTRCCCLAAIAQRSTLESMIIKT